MNSGYKVSIFNNGIETVIHAPNPDKNAPHLLNLPFKESLSQAEQLSFSIPWGNPGYNLIQGLITKVKVIDTRDNSVTFSGRVLPTKDGMDTTGEFLYQVTCEGAMNYLHDSQTRRWHLANQTPEQILTYLLNQHNSRMGNDDGRKIYLGTVEVTQNITVDTNYETTLNTIISKIRNVLGGDLRVQERDGLLYLDYLIAQGTNNEVFLEIGKNLKKIIRNYEPSDLITRGIVLGYGEGVNQLDITKVNNGVEYLEDTEAISKYGVIEGLITNKDIQNADTLKIYGQTVLNEKKQPALTIDTAMIDRSVLSQYELEKYSLGDSLHIIVPIMNNLDVYARVIERTRDLIKSPWDPDLAISTRPITLTDQIVDLKQRNLTLENAPQGSTCIFPLCKAENADADHPIEFDLDIPVEAININKVYINLHGRKFRTYEKGAAAGGGISVTSGSSSKTTSDASSKSTSDMSTGLYQIQPSAWGSGIDMQTPPDNYGQKFVPVDISNGRLDLYWLCHAHDIEHKHGMNHTHGMDHTHLITILAHIHNLIYGIFEADYPKNVKVSVNGNDIGVNYGNGTDAFDEFNIDITSFVNTGNNKIVISTEQLGRIDAIVYAQIFIQAK